MTSEQKKALQQLREAGYAVITWTPEELANASPRRVEDRCVEAGNDFLDSARTQKT